MNINNNLSELKNLRVVSFGTALVEFNGFTDGRLINNPLDKRYAVLATNGDWNNSQVNIIGTLYSNGEIRIRIDKAITGSVRVNYVVFDISENK